MFLALGKPQFDIVNKKVVSQIMEQDIKVLTGQQENQSEASYLDQKYVLLTESDAMILEFRKWCQTFMSREFVTNYS